MSQRIEVQVTRVDAECDHEKVTFESDPWGQRAFGCVDPTVKLELDVVDSNYFGLYRPGQRFYVTLDPDVL